MPYRLLIADDEITIRKGLTGYMPWSEIDCVADMSARDGLEAIELIKNNPPDIVVTDIKMPLASGIDVAKYVSENHPGIKVIILTGYADFEYARCALRYGVSDYVLKPISRDVLMESVKNCVRELAGSKRERRLIDEGTSFTRNEFFEELALSDGADTTERVIANASDYGVTLSDYRIIAFQNATLGHGNSGLDFIRKALSDQHPDDYTYYRGNYLFWVQKNDSGASAEIIRDICREFVGIGENLYAYSVCAGISAVSQGLSTFSRTEAEAIEACEQRFYTENSVSLSDRSAALPTSRQNGAELLELLLVIENSLRSGDFEKSAKAINGIFDYSAAARMPADEIIAVCKQIHYLYCRHTASKPDFPDFSDFPDFPAGIDKCGTLAGLKRAVLSFHDNAAGYAKKRLKHGNPVVEKAVKFILANYSGSISLETIAESIPVNSSHLSRTFKKECGETVTDYINKVRVDKARELLSETGMLAYEVSGAVGFNDPTYFSMVFKKYTGISPKDYKNHTN